MAVGSEKFSVPFSLFIPLFVVRIKGVACYAGIDRAHQAAVRNFFGKVELFLLTLRLKRFKLFMSKASSVATASNTKELRNSIIEGIQEKKGRQISVVDLSGIESAPTSQFIICQGNSSQQVAAIADSVREYLFEHDGVKPYNYDGYRNAQWIVIDYGETLVHVFTPEARQLYNLEELWADAPVINIPDLD